MLSRLWRDCALRALFFSIFFAVFLFVPAGDVALAFDWLPGIGPAGGEVWTLARAPNGDVYAGIWWQGGALRSTDQGRTWQETALPYVPVNKIVINNAGTVFAALGNGDVQRSSDHGASWQSTHLSLVGNFGSVAYDPDLDVLFAAKYEKFSRSVDGGENWETVGTGFPAVQVQCLEAVPNGGPLFVGTMNNKVYRSVDGGVIWDQFDSGLTTNGVMDFLLIPGDEILAASFGGGVYRAAVDGAAWTQSVTGLDDTFLYAVGRDGPGRLWAGTASSGTYLSIDDGQTWAPGRSGIGKREIHDFLPLDGPEMLAGCYGGGVFRTVDTGVWEPSNTGMNRTHITDLLMTGTGMIFATTHGAGVFRSNDGGATWDPANAGIEDADVYDIAEHPDGDLFCGTWTTQIYRSTDGGDSWSPTGSLPVIQRVGCLAVKASSGDLFVGGYFEGGIWRSSDKGNTWVSADGGLPDSGMLHLVVEEDGGLLVAVDAEGIYRSENDGALWEPINNGLTSMYVNQVLSLPGGILFAAIPYHGLFRSLDDGASWQVVDASLDNAKVGCIATNENGFLFAGIYDEGRVYQSIDGGDSWFDVMGSFPHAPIRELAFNSDGNLLAGTGGFGVLYTDETTPVFLHGFTAERTASGAVALGWSFSWSGSAVAPELFRAVKGGPREQVILTPFEAGPDFTFVDEKAPAEACDYWLRLTDPESNPSWFGPVSVEKVDLAGPGLAIESVWPNPAAGSTMIRFSKPKNESVRLEIYDLQGRLVRRLGNQVGMAEALETSWNLRDGHGRKVPAGAYFVRLSSADLAMTRKVLVVGQ